MLWVLFSVAIVIAVYFVTRFFLLKKAMKEANREFRDILKDIQQNQILHMEMPDKELENMAQSVNQALEQIRTERQEYEKRERAFQSEIENISHDLRTPLTVILGYLKLMKGQKEPDMEMVETIERKAKTMQRLVTDFYDLSRLSARDYEVEIKETDAGRILRESLMDSYHILEKRALELEAEIPEHIIEVLGDALAVEKGRHGSVRELEASVSGAQEHMGRLMFFTDCNLMIKEKGQRIYGVSRDGKWKREIEAGRFRPEIFLRKITLIEGLVKEDGN